MVINYLEKLFTQSIIGYKSNQAGELLRGIPSQRACRDNYEDETSSKKTF